MKKRMHFRPSHRDKAERHIITALRSVGASVFQVNGKDIPDLLCGFRGVTYLLECKSRLLSEEKGRAPRMRTTKVSEGQKAFAAGWRGGPSAVVHTPHEALMAVGAPRPMDAAHDLHWVAENGAYLCESCWLPENGLHAKDCPTRLALKRPPKVETAHRAAKKAREVLPKSHQDRLNEAGAVDLRDNMRLEHLGGGYARAVPINPTKRHGDTPDWMAEAVREHHEELRKAKTCAMGPCQRPRVDDERFCDIHVGGIILVDLEETEPRKPLTLAGLQAAVKRIHEPRGVEGELQLLPKP